MQIKFSLSQLCLRKFGLMLDCAIGDAGRRIYGAHPMPRSANIFFRSFTGIALSSSRLEVMSGSSTLGALRACGCGLTPAAATCRAQHLDCSVGLSSQMHLRLSHILPKTVQQVHQSNIECSQEYESQAVYQIEVQV